METLLISENLVSQFKFWRDGQTQTGMRFRNELFCYVSKFDSRQRHKVFELAWNLACEGAQVVITAERSQYTVWVSLRSPNPTATLEQIAQTLAVSSTSAKCSQQSWSSSAAAEQAKSLESSLAC